MLHEHWGGIWSDAEKTVASTEDDRMCWAAAAANVLDWTGWGRLAGFADSDAVFQHFQDHWTDEGGLMAYGWSWWFSGTNPSQQWAGWSHVDVPGGAYFDDLAFLDYYQRTGVDARAMEAIDQYLTAGYGVAIIATAPGQSHALTVWGVQTDDVETLGIWVTDSDDDRTAAAPEDVLRYIPVYQDQGRWFLDDPQSATRRYINEVQALGRAPGVAGADAALPGAPIAPEPTTLPLLVGAGFLVLRRRRQGLRPNRRR